MWVFDWLRERVPEKVLPKVSVTSIEQCARASCYHKILALIDEAEAKWGEDCCEIVPLDKEEFGEMFHRNYVFMGCDKRKNRSVFSRTILDGMIVCPYCGKPIKIIEVK